MLKRMVSFFLTLAMVITMLPVQAIALETETEPAELILETEPTVEETEPTEEVTEPVVEETEAAEEVTEPVAEETEATEEVTEPVAEETEATEEVTEPVAEETEPAEEQPVLEEIEQEPMLAGATSGTCGANAIWNFDASTSTLTISGTGAMADYAYYTDLPWESYRSQINTVVIENGITSIGSHAFLSCRVLNSITIPDSVTTIGSNAFSGCSSLTSIELPAGLKTIGMLAFDGCSSMPNVVIPNGVEEIGVHTFRYCTALGTITIPGTVTTIAEKTFEGCENLVTVTIEEGVTSIGERAFDYCYGLTNVSIPDTLTDIAEYAFHSCTSLQSVTIPAGVTTLNKSVFGGCSSLQSVELPNTLTAIDEGVFVDCSSMTSIDIPDSVTSIGSRAFMGCGSLTAITIPAGVTTIASETFAYCENMDEIIFEGNAPTFAEDAFYNLNIPVIAKYDADNATWTKDIMQNYGGYIVWLPIGQTTSGTCGESLTWEVDEYFGTIYIYGSGAMTDYSPENPAPWIAFADYVYQIYALDTELTTVGNYAFAGMNGISTVSLPETVTCIGEGAFSGGNDTLQDFTVLEGVREIGKDAFADCTKLSKVTFKGQCPTIADTIFSEDMTLKAFYPKGDTTWTENVGKSYGGNVSWYAMDEEGVVEGTCGDHLTWSFTNTGFGLNPGQLTISGTGEMYDYNPENPAPWNGLGTSVQRLTIESSVESIGDYAFAGLTKLGAAVGLGNSSPVAVTLPATISAIGENAFAGCSSLKKLVFQGDAPSDMAETIFSEDMTLSVYYPYGNSTWTETVRKNYGGNIIWSVVDPDGNETSGTCGTSATWRYDPDSVTLTISGSGAMSNYNAIWGAPSTPWKAWNTTIEKIVIETGITHIGSSAFRGLTALKQVIISESVETIGTYAFSGCSILSNLQLPDSVTEIGNYAFQNCAALALHIPAGVSSIPTGAIRGVKSLSVAAANANYVIENGLLLSKDKTILFGCAVQQESYLIPDTVTVIEAEAFCQHPRLLAVTIPASVKTIGNAAFAGCTNLVNVTVKGKLTEIGESAFADSVFTSIWFQADAPEYIYDTAFTNVSSNAYYPAENETWTETVMQSYGGNLIWMNANSGTCGENLTWIYDVNVSNLIISGAGAMTNYSIENPAPWSGSIEALQGIIVEPGVTTIGDYAFAGMPQLYGLELPESLKTIGEGAFSGTGINMTELTIPAGVAEIGKDAFSGCLGISRIAFQGDLPTLAETLFSEGMTLIATYPNGNTTWKAAALKNYGGNISWFARNESGNLVGTCGEKLTWSYKFNSGLSNNSMLTISGTGAMTDYSAENPAPWSALGTLVQKVTIEEGVESIGDYAFAELTKLGYAGTIWGGSGSSNTIILPASLEKIGANAFSGCTSLKKIEFKGNAPEFAQTIFSENMTLTAQYPYGNETWAAGVKKGYGGNVSWSGCDESGTALEGTCGTNAAWNFDLVSATLTISGSGAMSSSGWSGLKPRIEKVVIGSGITSIAGSAFSGCSNLKQIDIPDTVTSIGDSAFQNCTALTLNIPSDVSSMGRWAVRGVKALTVDAANETYASADGMLLTRDMTTVHSYAALQETYLIPDSVTVIADEAFCDHPSLTSIVIPEGVEYIGAAAFAGCANLETVDLPNSLVELGECAFSCAGMKEVTVPKNVSTLTYAVFAGCEKLVNVIIEGGSSEIGQEAFAQCISLESIRFKENAPVTVAENAFAGVTATAYYPAFNTTWEEYRQNYGGILTWIPAVAVENTMAMEVADLEGQTSVWIDGREYAVTIENSIAYVDLPNGNAKTMVVHTYGEIDGKQYPNGMKVWILSSVNNYYTPKRVEELDNILTYDGCSIRVTGTQGIRMITSIDQGDKAALTGNGLAGYTLEEYGTAVAWAGQISKNVPLVLNKSYVSSNYAYSREAGKDPIFAATDDRMQYTNVLVGFDLDQCKDDFAMRPYMILADAEGNEITLYGGIVERSIGYIAYRNRNVFDSGTDAYKYIWEIIHHVYGDAYDAEYKG